MPNTNPSAREIAERLARVRTVAVVGLSPDPSRPSHDVAHAVQTAGFRIVPVRPGGGEILGETVYPDLASIPQRVDLVDVFRRPEHVAGVVDEAIAAGIGFLWLQDGVIDEAAAARAREAGIFVVMDRCLKRDGLPLVQQTVDKTGKS